MTNVEFFTTGNKESLPSVPGSITFYEYVPETGMDTNRDGRLYVSGQHGVYAVGEYVDRLCISSNQVGEDADTSPAIIKVSDSGESLEINKIIKTNHGIEVSGGAIKLGVLSVGDSVTIDGNTTINGNTTIGGITIFENDAQIKGSIDAESVIISGEAKLCGKVSFGEQSSDPIIVIEPSDTRVLSVKRGVAIDGSVSIGGEVTINNSARFSGAVIVDSNLSASSVSASSEISASSMSISSSATIGGDTTISGTATIGNGASITGDTSITGVMSASTLSINGEATVGEAVVNGGATIGGETTIGGKATVTEGGAEINGDVTINGKLTVDEIVGLSQIEWIDLSKTVS